MGFSSVCAATELLQEKIKNLKGMAMGCQQEIVTLESSIEKREQVLEQIRRGSYNYIASSMFTL